MMFKIKSIRADTNLLYSIQNTTKDSTAKILGFFQNLALKVAEDHYEKKSNSLSKTLKWMYGDIPFSLYVYHSSRRIGSHELFVMVKVHQSIRNFNVSEIIDQDLEYSLGLEGSRPVGNFAMPVLKAPTRLKPYLNGEEVTVVERVYKKPKKPIDVENLPEELRLKYGVK